MRGVFCFLLLGFVCLTGAHAAGDRIWSAIVLATRETPSKPIPKALKDYAPTIVKVFGYNTLYFLGDKKQDIKTGEESWLVPNKELFFRVQCLKREVSTYVLQVDLYQEKTLLLSTTVRLARDAPLYIRGPQWGKGQLILLLEVI